MPDLILLDNTILTNLALVEYTEIVFHLWKAPVYTTQAVMQEYQTAVRLNLLPLGIWQQLPIIELNAIEVKFADGLTKRLGIGERSCIAIAHKRNGAFASDDADARVIASRLGIPVTGTLGILVLAIKQEHLSTCNGNNMLRDLIRAGYRSPIKTLDELL